MYCFKFHQFNGINAQVVRRDVLPYSTLGICQNRFNCICVILIYILKKKCICVLIFKQRSRLLCKTNQFSRQMPLKSVSRYLLIIIRNSNEWRRFHGPGKLLRSYVIITYREIFTYQFIKREANFSKSKISIARSAARGDECSTIVYPKAKFTI